MIERTTSQYDSKKSKVILSVTEHHKGKFFTLCKMYGVSGNFMFQLIVDEMYFDPLQPTLPKRLEASKDRVNTFFRKRHPSWGISQNRTI